jgi:GNAT superfamily N-acetyltransferase
VRRARPDDAEAIAALMTQLGYDVPAPAVTARLQRLGERRDVFVATDGKRVIGWAALLVDEAFVEGFGAFLEGFVVDDAARSRGVGRQLLEAVESPGARTWLRRDSSAVQRPARARPFVLRTQRLHEGQGAVSTAQGAVTVKPPRKLMRIGIL